MRLIDADVAIEELTDRSHRAAKRVGTDSPFWEGLVIARRIVNNLPTVQPETQWIPVSERMPEDYVDVLVWFEYFRYGNYNCMYAMHGIGNYSKEYNSWTINHETGWKDLHVFAWMPLPEPYQKGADT